MILCYLELSYTLSSPRQSRYQCCGGRGNSGFLQWEEHLNGTYPDSCCTVR